jgi:hypothetical protein
MTRIKKGIQSCERWDKVKLENGIIGYIYQNYVSEISDNIQIEFKDEVIESNFKITGIYYKNNSVSNIKEKIQTNLDLEIVNNKNEVLQNDNLVGTGSKISLKENGAILRQYEIVLYGDANGDGKINSTDLLVIQRHILELEELEEIYQKASNIRKSGKQPNSVDLLLIQRHILELEIIEQ